MVGERVVDLRVVALRGFDVRLFAFVGLDIKGFLLRSLRECVVYTVLRARMHCPRVIGSAFHGMAACRSSLRDSNQP
eukprot:929163-Pleurochrysis_carterae.AAC.1